MESPPFFDELGSIRSEIELHNIYPSKKFGQNFLLDMNITDKIARIASVEKEEHIIEIGSGPAGLTRSLLACGAYVHAIETDNRLYPLLERVQQHYPQHLNIVKEDALKQDLDSVIPPPLSYKIIANLPYNIATPLLTKWLSHAWPPRYNMMALMFQKEVAERIIAQPNTKAYGRLAILTQWRCDVHIAMTLPPEAFFPPPKVHSAVVCFYPKKNIENINLKILETLTQAIFHQRRKKIRSGLKSILPNADEVLPYLDIDPNIRGEALPVKEFLRLADFMESPVKK